MKERFTNFVTYFGRRRTIKEKKRFVENLMAIASQLKIPASIVEEKIGITTISNVVMGNLNQSKYIFIVGYDTTETMLNPFYTYRPLQTQHNKRQYTIQLFLRFMIGVILFLFAFYLFKVSMGQELLLRTIYVVIGILLGVVGVMISKGLSNYATFSKSASIFCVLELLKENMKNTSYVFCDYASYTNQGLQVLKDKYPNIDKKICIYLDCLANGSELFISYDSNLEVEAAKLEKYIQNSQLNYNLSETKVESNLIPPMITISLCDKNKKGNYYVKNCQTNKDRYFDLMQFELVYKSLLSYIKGDK